MKLNSNLRIIYRSIDFFFYTPRFISQIFTKKLHTSLLLIGTGIGSIINKKLENDNNNNSKTHETDHTKKMSTIVIRKSVTKKSKTNMIGSTTSTTGSIPQEKLCAARKKLIKLKKQ